jgi:hypothetical protein
MHGRATTRLKAHGEEEKMLEGPVVYRNGALRGTSAWANTFLGGIITREKQEESETPRATEGVFVIGENIHATRVS